MLDLKIDWLTAEETTEFKRVMNSEEFLNFAKLDIKESDLISTRIYVVRIDFDIIGYFGLDKFDDDSCCVCFLYVKKELRNKGIGKEIIRLITEEILKDTPYIYGIVDKENVNAIEFYKKHYKFLLEFNGFRGVYNYEQKFLYELDNAYEVVFKYDRKGKW